MNPRRLLAVAIAGLLATGSVGAMAQLRRVDTITVADAVARFRAAASTTTTTTPAATVDGAGVVAPTAAAASTSKGEPGAGAPSRAVVASAAPAIVAAANRPTPGVYVYRTSGHEELGIPSSGRDYPAETTMTVSATPCGADVHWDAFKERWDLWSTCSPDSRVELQAFTTYHQFFGQVERRHYRCAPGADLRPPATASTSGRCADGDAVVRLTAQVVGVERITVGAVPVDTVHIRLDEVLTGPTAGTRASDSWYRVSDSLLVRRTAVTHVTTQTAFGHTSYDENLRLDLRSVEPLR